jgi:heat shock protein HtpX
MGARVIQQPGNPVDSWLLATVQRQASAAGIGMPEAVVYQSPDPNAFATGARRNSALVAVGSGLLESLSRNEVEAVLAHEVSHVANGDMVTLTLIRGVVNSFVIFLSRLVGFFGDRVLLGNERGLGPGLFIASLVAQIALGILATMIVMWFSRQREFRADAGGARLAGCDNMIAALARLRAGHAPSRCPEQLQAFGIAGAGAGLLSRLFRSHPPLDERIAELRRAI